MDSKEKKTPIKPKNSENKKNENQSMPADLMKQLSNSSSQNPAVRFISVKFNPIILLLIGVLVIFMIFILGNRNDYLNKISLDELIKGIKDNRYSQVLIQNDGKIVANGKTFISYTGTGLSNENLKTAALEKTTLDSVIESLQERDLVNQIRSALNRESSVVQGIIVAENYVIIDRISTQQDLLIEDITSKDFFSKLEDKGIDYRNFPFPVSKLKSAESVLTVDSFKDRVSSKQTTTLWQVGNNTIGALNSEYVTRSFIDWTPSIYSFTDVLQQENISLSTENVEIISSNVPSGVSLDDILTILTLVGFVILGVIIFRGAQSSGMGIMQFGQSKAKVFFGSKTDTTFKDVAGIDEARNELNEIVDFLKNPNKYRKLGARIPKGVLMVGPPGTGKTLLARAIAGEAAVPFFHTSGSEFEEMLVGAGASRVRDLFSKAKKASPSLIFIDEIDAVARKRGTRIQSGTTEQTLNQILVEMDGFEKNTNVIVIAATNRPDVLDPAILRPGRFDRQVRIDLPDMEGRKQILEIHGKNKPFADNVDLEKVAKRTVSFTGADLENILNEAAIIAAGENKKQIFMDDIEEAVSKVVIGPAKKSRKRTDNELKLVAYHEAGHAVVSRFTPNATPLDKISIVSRGSTGGVTMFLPEKDEYIMSKNKLIADITVSLGGRAAEAVALEDISTGASNDIEKATQVAKRMVQRFGMSDKLGLVQYGEFMDSEYLGYGYGESKDYSDKTAEMIDAEVKSLIENAYSNALKILTDHRDKLDAVANALLEKEVLSKEEFEELF
jgi:cell division protease FtsH